MYPNPRLPPATVVRIWKQTTIELIVHGEMEVTWLTAPTTNIKENPSRVYRLPMAAVLNNADQIFQLHAAKLR